MDNNFTVTVALITAFAAIIAPLITSVINAIIQYKLKRLDLMYPKKVEVLKKFIEAYTSLNTNLDLIFTIELEREALNLAVLCKNKKTRKELFNLVNLVLQQQM
jgi:hypothetical protein